MIQKSCIGLFSEEQLQKLYSKYLKPKLITYVLSHPQLNTLYYTLSSVLKGMRSLRFASPKFRFAQIQIQLAQGTDCNPSEYS